MKRIYKAVLVFVLFLAVAAAAVYLSLNTLIERGIEKGGSKSLGVPVELSNANLSIVDGKLDISGLLVSNPDGFEDGPLFELRNASTSLRPAALLQDEILIDNLTIDSPSLAIEHSIGGTNLGKILANINGEPSAKRETKSQKRYRIRVLQINGAKVTIDSFLTEKPPVTISLPDIQLENVSNADGTGLTLAQIYEKVFVKMMETALRTGKAKIPAEVMLDVSNDLSQFAPELGLDLSEKVRGIVEKANQTLKDLFKSKSEEP